MKKVYSFKALPRMSRWVLALKGHGSSLAGWRDGRQGVPDPDDPNLPANVHRRVYQANAWMNGKLARRYFRERNKLQGQQQKIEGAINGLSSTASLVESALATSNLASVSSAPGGGETATAGRRPSVARSEKAVVRTQSTLVYVIFFIVIFVGESILNKKAFELFSETDATLWLMVSGLAVGLVLAAHLIGHSWKRSESERRAVSMLIVLSIVAFGAAFGLGTMRYLTVDNQRQQTITVLNQQIASVQTENAAYKSQRNSLGKQQALTRVEEESLLILERRIAAGQAEIASAKAQRSYAQNPRGVDRAIISIPLFMFLNIFLIVVMSALSYYHYDPAAAKAAARRRHRRWRGFVDWLQGVPVVCRERKKEKRARLEEKRRLKELGEVDERTRQGAELAAAAESIDKVLDILDSAYRAACAETESLYEAAIRCYWVANNRQTMRNARKSERDWRRTNREAVDEGRPPVERDETASWKRPKSQDIPLQFQRPPEHA